MTTRGSVQEGPLDFDDDAAIAFIYGGKRRTLSTRLPVCEAKPILAALARCLPVRALEPGLERYSS